MKRLESEILIFLLQLEAYPVNINRPFYQSARGRQVDGEFHQQQRQIATCCRHKTAPPPQNALPTARKLAAVLKKEVEISLKAN